jgi:hypothetical protein
MRDTRLIRQGFAGPNLIHKKFLAAACDYGHGIPHLFHRSIAQNIGITDSEEADSLKDELLEIGWLTPTSFDDSIVLSESGRKIGEEYIRSQKIVAPVVAIKSRFWPWLAGMITAIAVGVAIAAIVYYLRFNAVRP